jgi:hypothetical protein
MKCFRRIIVARGAAKASESTLFVAPAHIAIQTVLHQVNAIELIAFGFNRQHEN